jgi:hypothetical protein
VLRNPTNLQVADCLGLNQIIDESAVHDVIIAAAPNTGSLSQTVHHVLMLVRSDLAEMMSGYSSAPSKAVPRLRCTYELKSSRSKAGTTWNASAGAINRRAKKRPATSALSF